MSRQRARRRAEREHVAALRTAARAGEQERRERAARGTGSRVARRLTALVLLALIVVCLVTGYVMFAAR